MFLSGGKSVYLEMGVASKMLKILNKQLEPFTDPSFSRRMVVNKAQPKFVDLI